MLSRVVEVGSIAIGGENPVAVQGMLKAPLDEPDILRREAADLAAAGAELIRCAIPDKKSALDVRSLLSGIGVPLIADCHFQPEIAMAAVRAGYEKVRVNPGNTGYKSLLDVIELAEKTGTAMRFGFNSGSCGAHSAMEIAEMALEWDARIRDTGYRRFVISMKSSSVTDTVDANRYFSTRSDTPLHIGITATGPPVEGTIKSAMGLGTLLLEGIGDTIRVSLTGDSLREIEVGVILRSIAEGSGGNLEIISCPTCSRCRIDVVKVLDDFTALLSEDDLKRPFKVAIMGCEVNGPGEASAADIGICGTRSGGILIRRGDILGRIEPGALAQELLKRLREL